MFFNGINAIIINLFGFINCSFKFFEYYWVLYTSVYYIQVLFFIEHCIWYNLAQMIHVSRNKNKT